MQVTNVKIQQIFSDTTKPLRAIASVTLDNEIAIHDIRVIQTADKMFIAMPNKKLADGSYKDTVHPVNDECRVTLQNAVLSAYDSYLSEIE